MGVVNRGLLFLYTLFAGLVSLGVVLVYLQVLPERILLNEYQYLMHQWQTAGVAVFLFLVSLHLLICSVSIGGDKQKLSSKDIVLVKSQQGSVNVSLAAIREMVERIGDKVNGVHQAKAKILVEHKKDEDYLNVDIRTVVGHDKGIGGVSDDLKQQVDKFMQQVVGIQNCNITVSVQSITDGVNVKKKRVN